jgi:hypothetical protein
MKIGESLSLEYSNARPSVEMMQRAHERLNKDKVGDQSKYLKLYFDLSFMEAIYIYSNTKENNLVNAVYLPFQSLVCPCHFDLEVHQWHI